MRPEQWLRDALRGDEAAFVGLLEMFEQPVYAYFRRRRVPPADAEDLTQQVFVTLLEAGPRFDSRRGPLRAFVFGLARRVWLRHFERAAAQPHLLAEGDAEVPAPADDHVETAERAEHLRAAIAELPGVAREILELRMNEMLPVSDIARIMDMPVSTVKSHLFRARQRLRTLLADALGLKER